MKTRRLLIGLILCALALTLSWRTELFLTMGLIAFLLVTVMLLVGGVLLADGLFGLERFRKKPPAGEEEGVRSFLDNPLILFTVIAILTTFLALPLMGVFNDLITRFVIAVGLEAVVRDILLPRMTSLVAGLLRLLGFDTRVYNFYLLEITRDGKTVWVALLWNCVGWQSLILLAVTFIVGLQGNYMGLSKGMVLIFGIQLTILVNIVRIVAVASLAFSHGAETALLFHEYGGTIMVLFVLFLFWFVSFRWILEKPAETEEKESEIEQSNSS